MLPRRVRVSPDSDETVVLRPGEPGYLAEHRRAAYDYQRFGRPMPYADLATEAPPEREE